MSFGESIKTVFTKYAEFRGVAGRPEFWWWILFSFLVSSVLGAIQIPMVAVSASGEFSITTTTLAGLWGLAALLPTLAVSVRRLRDAGYGWGNLFWVLLPIAGLIVLIVLCAKPTQVPRAAYAPPPGYAQPPAYAPPAGYGTQPGYGAPPAYAPPPPAATPPSQASPRADDSST